MVLGHVGLCLLPGFDDYGRFLVNHLVELNP